MLLLNIYRVGHTVTDYRLCINRALYLIRRYSSTLTTLHLFTQGPCDIGSILRICTNLTELAFMAEDAGESLVNACHNSFIKAGFYGLYGPIHSIKCGYTMLSAATLFPMVRPKFISDVGTSADYGFGHFAHATELF